MPDPAALFVVLAEFSVPAEHKAEFLKLCAFDATSSVRDEPGCRQFEAHTVEDAPEAVILYEVYDDRAAFDAHLQTPHYATFADGVERLGVAKVQVRMLTPAGA